MSMTLKHHLHRGAATALAAVLFAGSALAQQPAAVTAPEPAADASGPVPTAPPAADGLGVAEPEGIAEGLAAVVNDDIISTYDLRQRMLLLIVSTGVRPSEQNLPQIEREALRSLVDERLQTQELDRRNPDILKEADVDEEIAQIAKESNLTGEQLLRQLAAQGVQAETLKEQVRADIGWRTLIRGLYGSRLRIGDDQIRAALQRIKATADKPQYLVGEIFIDAARVGGMTEATSGAEQLIVQMQAGAPFTAVARQFSASSTAAGGGDAGWLTGGQIAPELEAALAQMRPGQISRPIPVSDGVWILTLREKRAGSGVMLVNLKQAAVRLPSTATETDVAAAQTKLEALRPTITGCADLEAKAAVVQGVTAGDLGETAIEELAPAFRSAAETLQPNQVSAPIRTQVGLHLVAVCGKRDSGIATPTEQEIENRLFGQQLSMLSRRFLRDLRSSATIESR